MKNFCKGCRGVFLEKGEVVSSAGYCSHCQVEREIQEAADDTDYHDAKIATEIRHREVILSHLRGSKTDDFDLWAAVGFFLHGEGASLPFSRNFATHQQWQQLKKDTGRT